MDKAVSLMADDMVWHNEGDSTMPWIGPWNGKEAILKFLRNIEDVVSTVPPERLLVHNFEDGWEPLCRWLDLPMPDVEYPRGNTTRDFNRVVTD